MSSSIFYRDAAAAIEWLCKAFGFEVRLKVEGEEGRIEHSELSYAGGLVMVGQEGGTHDRRLWRCKMQSPLSLAGANTQCVMIYVDDVDSHCARAKACGAQVVEEPQNHDYGEAYWSDRSYGVLDIEGHLWWVTQRLRNPPQT